MTPVPEGRVHLASVLLDVVGSVLLDVEQVQRAPAGTFHGTFEHGTAEAVGVEDAIEEGSFRVERCQ